MSVSDRSGARIDRIDSGRLTQEKYSILNTVPTAGGKPLAVYSTLGHCPELLRRIMALAKEFHSCDLNDADREAVVLTVASSCNSDYLFNEHLPLARKAGITDVQVNDLYQKYFDESLWDQDQAALVCFAKRLLCDDSVTDEVWNNVSFHGDPVRMVELVSLIGFYRMIAMFTNAVRLDLDDFQPCD